MSTFIIAELGSTWLYTTKQAVNLQHGKRLIALAAEAGCNAVKVQWVSDPAVMAKRRQVPVDTYQSLAWPIAWHSILRDTAHALGLEYLSTVFLPCDVAKLSPYVDRYKVASLEYLDRQMQTILANQSKPVIYSTGCCQESEVFTTRGIGQTLHCVASYPAPPEEMNLRVLRRFAYDGLSDHSGDVLTGAFAVMAGATVVEAHIRLDGTPKRNPDFLHSHNPASFTQYVDNIRLAERMLGDGVKKIEACERAMVQHRVTG
jgi:N-acetylneuraminate synthase